MSFSDPDIRLVEVLGPGVVVLSFDGDRAIWSEGRMRKLARCAVSGRPLGPGDKAYRPVGNQMYRARRISVEVIEAAIRQVSPTPVSDTLKP